MQPFRWLITLALIGLTILVSCAPQGHAASNGAPYIGNVASDMQIVGQSLKGRKHE